MHLELNSTHLWALSLGFALGAIVVYSTIGPNEAYEGWETSPEP